MESAGLGDDTGDSAGTPRESAPHSRRSNGCVTCRLRKVRCDERRPCCRNCEVLDFRCSFSLPESDLPATQKIQGSGVPRRRSRQACKQCHAQKVRCTAEAGCCRRCRIKGMQCQYETKSSPNVTLDVGRSPGQDAPDTPPDTPHRSIVLEAQEIHAQPASDDVGEDATQVSTDSPRAPSVLRPGVISGRSRSVLDNDATAQVVLRPYVDAFFTHVWPVAPFNFIHRGSFMRTWHHGRLSKALICVVVSIGSRFVVSDNLPNLPCAAWIDEIQKETTQDLEHVSLPKLQIILLLIYERFASGNLTTVFYLISLASRIAYALQLNYPTTKIPWVNQECRRRLMWCTYTLDKQIAGLGGLDCLTLCPRESIHLQLPCDAQSFDLEAECHNPMSLDVGSGQASKNLGLGGYLVHIVELKDLISKYILDVRRDPNHPTPWDGCARFWDLKHKLNAFVHIIPPDLRDTDRALFIRADTAEFTSWMMLHTHLYSCHISLVENYVDLAHTTGSSPNRTDFIYKCVSESAKVCEVMTSLWRRTKKFSKAEFVSDWFMGPCILQQSKMLLRLADIDAGVMGGTVDISTALQLNLEILGGTGAISQYFGLLHRDLMAMVEKSPSITLGPQSQLTSGPHNGDSDLESILRIHRRREDDRWPPQEAAQQNISPMFTDMTRGTVPTAMGQDAGQGIIPGPGPVNDSGVLPVGIIQGDNQTETPYSGSGLYGPNDSFSAYLDEFLGESLYATYMT